MTTVRPKSPCQEIDEEEQRNHHEPPPTLEIFPQPSSSINSSPPPPPPPQKTEEEKKRDILRCQIDTITYQSRLDNLIDNLELERKRDRLRLEEEIATSEFTTKKRKLNQELEYLELQLKVHNKKDEVNKWVDNDPEYQLNPIKTVNDNNEKEIIVSDRIIDMPLVIVYQTSTYITERIDYYNNQSTTLPIFIIIDYCIGGSVMAGYRIQKAIESSPAQVYIIVKSFAASMAASLTTMSDNGYLYPNAIMLHHQMFTGSRGNMTQRREHLKDDEEWWDRLAGPLVKKLGINLNTWIEKMYHANSDGDWRLFGDQAVREGWATGVVDRIRKTGQIRHPDTDPAKSNSSNGICCQTHAISPFQSTSLFSNQPSNQLPRLLPMDQYWLYDPQCYYQISDK